MTPLLVELFAGSCTLSAAFCAAGWRSIAFDIEHQPWHGTPPEGCQLVLQDVLTLDGAQFRDADFIWASPPCRNYSYLAMPWSKSPDWFVPDGDGWRQIASPKAKEMRRQWESEGPDNRLFEACFRIQREAIEATRIDCPECGDDEWERFCSTCAGVGSVTRHIPMIVENVRGAQAWVGAAFYGLDAWKAATWEERKRMGKSAWNFGSFHLWGDVPALMPHGKKFKSSGMNWSDPIKRGQDFTRVAGKQAIDGIKVPSATGRRTDPGNGVRFTSRDCGIEGVKIGGDWMRDPNCHSRHGSRSSARKAASAKIAEIPHSLAEYLAEVMKPRGSSSG